MLLARHSKPLHLMELSGQSHELVPFFRGKSPRKTLDRESCLDATKKRKISYPFLDLNP
jgi:hypothetical protein